MPIGNTGLYLPEFHALDRYADLIEKIDAWEGGQADGVARWIMANLSPKSVIDIGCASGLYLLPFLSAGIEVLGIDGAPTAGGKLPPENYMKFDLRNPLSLSKVFDVCICLETGEHIECEYTDIFVRTVARSARILVWSAAQPGQGGEGHFNCQPRQYWLDKFTAYGFQEHPLNADFQTMIHENEGPTSYYHPWLIHNSIILERKF
jgi:SAM-dependent methyltransferase